LGYSQTRNMRWHRIPVGAVGRHCVVCVGNSDYSREEWDLVVDEAVGVPVAVNAFVVVTHDPSDLLVVGNFLKDPLTDDRVLLHETPFVERQRTRLFEKAGWKSNLSNVMHKATQVCHVCLAL